MAAPRVLVLGGTGEGRALADALNTDGYEVISSLAGRVSSPRTPAGRVRTGGFGGADGLRSFLRAEGIRAVIDATHPFAARITANAVAACAVRDDRADGNDRAGTALLVLRRPPWQPGPADRWLLVPDLACAARTVADRPEDARVLLTTGRQESAVFATLPQRFWLRAVEAPSGALPQRCTVILDRGPFTADAERALLTRHGIDLLVTKNSGGPMTSAKLTAAADLGIEVVMVERPALPPEVATVPDVAAARAWLGRHCGRPPVS